MNGSIEFKYPCKDTNQCHEYTVTLFPGRFLLEVWGADGGNWESTPGGRGGYASGVLTLRQHTKAFIHVGGKGFSPIKDKMGVVPGGYNKGGAGYCNFYGGRITCGAGGGGATDIRLRKDDPNYRIIVGGGGGGEGHSNISIWNHTLPGANAGGQNGEDGVCISGDVRHFETHGGKNNAPGESYCKPVGENTCRVVHGGFAFGGDAHAGDDWGGGGGGAGWFGGAAGIAYGATGSGGSSYAFHSTSFKPNSFKLFSSDYLLDTKVLNATEGFPSTDVALNGNGYARIGVIEYFTFSCNNKRRFSFLSMKNLIFISFLVSK